VNKASDLTFMRYNLEFQSLIKDLLGRLNFNSLPQNFKNKIQNLNFFARHNCITKERFIKRLQSDFSKENKEAANKFNDTLNYFYTFRINKKNILKAYKKEITELIESSFHIVKEAADEELLKINENISHHEKVTKMFNSIKINRKKKEGNCS
jgi:hypothetical protein